MPAFVARQPIFDHRLDVVGYELLFRAGGYADAGGAADSERESATVLLNTLTELDLERIVGTKDAWVRVPREFVHGGLVQAVPPGVVGLQIAASDLDDAVLDAIADLKAQGYRLALYGVGAEPVPAHALELVEIVRLNLAELGREGLKAQAAALRSFHGQVIADHLGSRSDHSFAHSAGCHLFQGNFYCQPAVVGTRGIAANRLALLQVVAALNAPDAEFADVEQLIARDVALSFRLLRYVNSAFFGLRGEVRSIGQALALLGLENLRRWATLSVLASVDNKPTALTVTALVRARFCELAGEGRGIGDRTELFTLGLFSVIDAMLDAQMHDVVAQLPLAEDMRDALVRYHGPLGRLLEGTLALEAGEPAGTLTEIPEAGGLYLDALMWADAAAESLFGTSEEGTARAAQAPAASRRVLTPPAADAVASTPPPGRTGAPVAVLTPALVTAVAATAAPRAVAAVSRPGFFARVFGRLFGRRDERATV